MNTNKISRLFTQSLIKIKNNKPQSDIKDQDIKKVIATLGDELGKTSKNNQESEFGLKTKLIEIINVIKTAPDANSGASIFGYGTTNAEENLFLLESAIGDSRLAISTNTFSNLIDIIKQSKFDLSKTNSRSYFHETEKKEKEIIKTTRVLTSKTTTLYPELKIANIPIKKSAFKTISNNGDAGTGYPNSCGAIAVYDAFNQKKVKEVSNSKRLEFARCFKDETYKKAQQIIKFCNDLCLADKDLNNDAETTELKNKGLSEAINDTGIQINQLILSENDIRTLANKTIQYSTESNKKICNFYNQWKTFEKLPELIKNIYGDHAVNYVRERLLINKEAIEKDIKEKQEIINKKITTKDPQQITKYNKTFIYKYQSENALKEITTLLDKIESTQFENVSTEDLFEIYKCTDHCFSPAAIYDIETLVNENQIAEKKQLFNSSYKRQQLSNAQIGIGLAKYGYVLDSIEQKNRTTQIVTYKNISNPEQNIQIVHFPGHWEALNIGG